MSIISSMRRQKAVFWARQGNDKFGAPSFQEPVEIDCRWEDGVAVMEDAEGTALTFNAVVYVDRPMKIGDVLRLGELESGDAEDPAQDPEAKTIQRFRVTPNIRNSENLYRAYL